MSGLVVPQMPNDPSLNDGNNGLNVAPPANASDDQQPATKQPNKSRLPRPNSGRPWQQSRRGGGSGLLGNGFGPHQSMRFSHQQMPQQLQDHQYGQMNNFTVAVPPMYSQGMRDNYPTRILVNTELVGALIGRRGETIKEMTTRTSARVDVKREIVAYSQFSSNTPTTAAGSTRRDNGGIGGARAADRAESQIVFIFGSPENCSDALREIMQICFREAKEHGKDDPSLGLLAEDRFCSRVIGKEGHHLNMVRQKSGAQITVSNVPTITTLSTEPNLLILDRVVNIRGTLSSICAAEELISVKLRQCYNQQRLNNATGSVPLGPQGASSQQTHFQPGPSQPNPLAPPYLGGGHGAAGGPFGGGHRMLMTTAGGGGNPAVTSGQAIFGGSGGPVNLPPSLTGHTPVQSHPLHGYGWRPPPSSIGGLGVPMGPGIFAGPNPASAGSTGNVHGAVGGLGKPQFQWGGDGNSNGQIRGDLRLDDALYMRIPHVSAGAVIGTEGASIKKIMEDSLTYVNVSKMSMDPVGVNNLLSGLQLGGSLAQRLVTIKGLPQNQAKAQWHIFQRVKTSSRQVLAPNARHLPPHGVSLLPSDAEVRLCTILRVPRTMIGRIIGREGRTVQQIQQATGTIVHLPKFPSEQQQEQERKAPGNVSPYLQLFADAELQPVEIYGNFESTQEAVVRIRTLVFTSLAPPPPLGSMVAPPATTMLQYQGSRGYLQRPPLIQGGPNPVSGFYQKPRMNRTFAKGASTRKDKPNGKLAGGGGPADGSEDQHELLASQSAVVSSSVTQNGIVAEGGVVDLDSMD